MILPFVQQNFTYVVDKTEYTNYGHIHYIVYLVIGRSSQDSYPFTSFAAAMGHANFRALPLSADDITSAIYSLLAYKLG